MYYSLKFLFSMSKEVLIKIKQIQITFSLQERQGSGQKLLENSQNAYEPSRWSVSKIDRLNRVNKATGNIKQNTLSLKNSRTF